MNDERPIIPGPRADHNMAEISFRNGAECMKRRVLALLEEIADVVHDDYRPAVLAVQHIVDGLDPMP